jgi:hydrogenase maturation factor HypF (carbamoyltransferase family)
MVSQIQKKLCSDCKAKFEVEWNDLEEGDAVSCPACNLEYTVIADKKGVLKLVESKDVEMEDEEEEESEESDTDDFDSD